MEKVRFAEAGVPSWQRTVFQGEANFVLTGPTALDVPLRNLPSKRKP